MSKREKAPPLTIYPIRDNVLILPDEDPEKVGSLFIPTNTAEMKKFNGTVVATGDGHLTADGHMEPLVVFPGDRVIYSKYAGSVIDLEDKQYILVKENDILAVVR